MTTEQGTQLAQLAADLDAAWRSVHAIVDRIDNSDLHDAIGADVRVMVTGADMGLDSAAEQVGRLAVQAARKVTT